MPHIPRTTPPEPETRPKRARIGPDASKTAPLISRAGYRFAGPLRIWPGGVAGSVPTTHIDLLSTKIIPQEATSMIQHANLRAKSKHCRNLTKRQSHRAFYYSEVFVYQRLERSLATPHESREGMDMWRRASENPKRPRQQVEPVVVSEGQKAPNCL